MTTDPTRPRLHFSAQEGWINDPLGLTWHDGRYHLFFQYVAHSTQWQPEQSWGHATSEDLHHWTEGPVALSPGDGDEGVWSGSIAVPDEGPPALFYTAVDLSDVEIGRARLARPVDETWQAWTKHEVVATLPADVDAIAYRDPYVFHDGTSWRMLMGAGLADGTATALTYRSEDLEHWSYDGLLAGRHRTETTPLWTGVAWECPQLFRLGDRWVLTVSVWEPSVPYYEAYAIGDLVDGRFVAEHWGRLSYGPSYYAGSAYADRDGRRGLIYWLRDINDPAGRWTGAHSLPHILRLDGARIVAAPHPELARSRVGAPLELAADGRAVTLGPSAELRWHAEPGARSSLIVRDVSGERLIQLDLAADELTATGPSGQWSMPVGGGAITTIVDGPVVEVFTFGGVMAVPIPSTDPRRTLAVTGSGTATCHELV